MHSVVWAYICEVLGGGDLLIRLFGCGMLADVSCCWAVLRSGPSDLEVVGFSGLTRR